MSLLRYLIVLSGALVLPSLANTTEQLTQLHDKLTDLAQHEIDATGIPSLQLAVGLKGSVLFEQGFGLSDVENQVPATSRTRYRTASISKWFTATAAMRLVQIGKLDLDAPIQDYCPAYPHKTHKLTARQLLNHTAGIRHYQDYESLIAQSQSAQQRRDLELRQLRDNLSRFQRYQDTSSPLALFKDETLLSVPGETWRYTSFGYRVLGCVLAGADQSSYSQLMHRLIFTPLNMRSTVADDAWAIVPDRASGYRLERAKPLRRADLRDVSENLPAGGHLSTATDLVRFAMGLQPPFVSAQHLSLMATVGSNARLDDASEPSWRDAIPAADKYGYGTMLWSKYRKGMIGHSGRQAGASSIVVVVPSSGVATAVMTNVKGWNGYLTFVVRVLDTVEAVMKIDKPA